MAYAYSPRFLVSMLVSESSLVQGLGPRALWVLMMAGEHATGISRKNMSLLFPKVAGDMLSRYHQGLHTLGPR